jgi:hypothetical protein
MRNAYEILIRKPERRDHIGALGIDRISEISGSHGGEYEDDRLLGCHAM